MKNLILICFFAIIIASCGKKAPEVEKIGEFTLTRKIDRSLEGYSIKYFVTVSALGDTLHVPFVRDSLYFNTPIGKKFQIAKKPKGTYFVLEQ